MAKEKSILKTKQRNDVKQYKTYVKVAKESDFLLAKPSGIAQQEEDDKLVVEDENLAVVNQDSDD